MENYMTYLWILVIIVSLVVEAGTYSLVALWFIPAAAAAIVLSLFKAGIPLQIAVFFIVALLCIVFLRKYLEKALKKKSVPTNADALIGKIGIVTEDIDNITFKGQVKVRGQVWTAVSVNGESINDGEEVEVLAIEGVKLICKKI
ncbi:MAG: NfeD family protein [Clostridia bacterium]|nr:NfeD family protein [Clostridia bacterium]